MDSLYCHRRAIINVAASFHDAEQRPQTLVPNHLPTIIVVHRRENRKKCSVEPLRDREGFVFWTYPDDGPESLEGYVRLGIGGPVLSESDRNCGLLVIDGTWRLAERMEKKFAHLPTRSLPPCQTAYPRVSKVFDDPVAGLATIEAIYLAYHLLGRDTSNLLDHYRWRDEFLKKNTELLSGRPERSESAR